MTKLAEVWQFSTDARGDTVLRTWREPGRPRFRVDIVYEPLATRELVAEFGSKKAAKKLARWFGRHGRLRAEVTRIAREANGRGGPH